MLDLQERICKVTREKSISDVPATMDKFEADYRKVPGKVMRTLDDLTLQNILLWMLPSWWER